MSITFEAASVTYTFIDPLDPKQTKHNHILNNLVEDPDEEKLIAIGEEFKLLLPNMTLSKITISTDAVLSGQAAATGDTSGSATDGEATTPTGEETETQPA